MRHFIAAMKPVYLVPLLCFGFYSGLFLEGKLRTAPNQFNYLKDMAHSFLSGKLDIKCPERSRCHDLALKDGKYYFYHASIGALVFMPLVLIWGQGTPDSLIAALIGTLNVLFFLFLIARLRAIADSQGTLRQIRVSKLRARAMREDWWFSLLWGLGTVHFYITMQGSVWHIAQILSQSFLLLAAIFIFTLPRPKILIAGIFFACAAYTRNDTILGALFFLAVIYKSSGSRKIFLRQAFIFLLPFLFLTVVSLFYNYARFGNPFEIGISYMKLEVQSGIAARVAEVGKFSFKNLWENIYQQVLKPPGFSTTFPFIHMDPHGFGILWATPAYLLIFPPIWRLYRNYYNQIAGSEERIVALGALLSAATIAFFLFLLSGHGYMQYAARYMLDLQLFLFIFLYLTWRRNHRFLSWGLLGISVYMNLAGAMLFTGFFRRVAGVP